MNRFVKVGLCAWLAAVAAVGCASGPNGNGSSVDAPPTGTAANLVTFSMSIDPNGVIDRTGEGYYCFLLNANGDPIDVTDLDTFTDMVRFDGVNFSWFHRVEGVPAPGFSLVFTTNLNDNGSISSDQHSLQVTFNVNDSTSPFQQFIVTNQFTADACTSDSLNNAVLGQIIDAYGTGPNLANDTEFTVTVNKLLGTLNPLPPNFPVNPLGDFITYSDLPPNFPYANFDMASFDVTVQQ